MTNGDDSESGAPRASFSGVPRATEDSETRECRVCGAGFVPADNRQVYCTQKCRWRRGHIEVAEARRRWLAQQPEQTYEELLDLFDRQDW